MKTRLTIMYALVALFIVPPLWARDASVSASSAKTKAITGSVQLTDNPSMESPRRKTASSNPTKPSSGIGINISGSEYSWGTYPQDYHLDLLQKRGITFVRLPVAWEKLQPKLGGDLDHGEVGSL